jgi:hypothetical protein
MKRMTVALLLGWGVVFSAAVQAESWLSVSNYSTPTSCAEEDNVNAPIYGSVRAFTITATHPVYTYGTLQCPERCEADFSNCSGSATGFPFTPLTTTLFDDGTTVVEAVREASWWLSTGMVVSVNHAASAQNMHYIRLYQKIAGVQEWPQFLVFYMDGNLRLIPHPRPGFSSVCFGSSVVVGPAPESARPYCAVRSVDFDTFTRRLTVNYVEGGQSVLAVQQVDRTAAVVRVTVNYPTTGPIATFRSMYVNDGTNDVSELWRTVLTEAEQRIIMTVKVMEFGPLPALRLEFRRTQCSSHNTTSPDLTLEPSDDLEPAASDFDADGLSDFCVFNPLNARWSVARSGSPSSLQVTSWGWNATVPVPGDYSGDGSAQPAVYFPGNGGWYIADTNYAGPLNWGWNESYPVPADYDGDGKTDLAVYYPPTGGWYIHFSGGGPDAHVGWGWSAALPVPADFDGDGRADIAVYFPGGGLWYIRRSTGGTETLGWGWSDALPVPADYDGDGEADLAVYYPGAARWYIRPSSGAPVAVRDWGWRDVIPVPADYTGDGRADLAVYNPNDGRWFQQGDGGAMIVLTNGGPNALPPVSSPALGMIFNASFPMLGSYLFSTTGYFNVVDSGGARYVRFSVDGLRYDTIPIINGRFSYQWGQINGTHCPTDGYILSGRFIHGWRAEGTISYMTNCRITRRGTFVAKKGGLMP